MLGVAVPEFTEPPPVKTRHRTLTVAKKNKRRKISSDKMSVIDDEIDTDSDDFEVGMESDDDVFELDEGDEVSGDEMAAEEVWNDDYRENLSNIESSRDAEELNTPGMQFYSDFETKMQEKKNQEKKNLLPLRDEQFSLLK